MVSNGAGRKILKKIQVEMDGFIAFKWIHAVNYMPNRCESLRDQDWTVNLKHVFRESNGVVDFLAKYALNLQVGFHEAQLAPEGIHMHLRMRLEGPITNAKPYSCWNIS